MVKHILREDPAITRTKKPIKLTNALVNGFIGLYDGPASAPTEQLYHKKSWEVTDADLDKVLDLRTKDSHAFLDFTDAWQKIPLLIQRGNDQSLRNSVYDWQKERGRHVTYSINGIFEKMDMEEGNLAEIKSALMATAQITLTRHPTTVFPDEVYEHAAKIGEEVHDLAKAVSRNEDTTDRLCDLFDAMNELKVAGTDFVHGKKDPSDEGREERRQLGNAYKGVTVIVTRFIRLINEIKDSDRQQELLNFVRDELTPVMYAVWGSGPDMDNNTNATAAHAEGFHDHAVADLKSFYKEDLTIILKEIPDSDNNKLILRNQLLMLIAANDNDGETSFKHRLAAIGGTLKSIDETYSDDWNLRIRIMDFLVKSRCFKTHFAHLDFRQDTEVTSLLSAEIFGGAKEGQTEMQWLNEQIQKTIENPDEAFEKLRRIEAELAQKVEDGNVREHEDTPLPSQRLETIRSLLLIRRKPDCARQYTLAQFKKPEHWMQMELLLRAAGIGQIGIVPLSEDDEALVTFGATMRALAGQPAFQQKLAALLHFTAMQAKSDPTRESGGYIAGSQMEMMIGYVDFACDVTLNNIQGIDFNRMFKSFFAIYAGGSLDNNRSMFNPAQVQHDFFRAIAYVAKKRGLKDDDIRKLGDAFAAAFQFTIQGRDADYCFGSVQSAADTMAKSYASGVHFKRGLQNLVNVVNDPENANVVDSLDNFIASCKKRKASYEYYFSPEIGLLNHQDGLLPSYIRKLANISSRKAGRKGNKLTDARAIDLQGFLHGAGIHVNEWLGAEIDTPEEARRRFKESPEERKQVLSTLLGLARCDFEGAYLLSSGRVPTQQEKDQAAAIIEDKFANHTKFDPDQIRELLTEASSGLEPMDAILAWLESKHQKAKINTLCALGLKEAGYTPEQIAKWDFAKQSLPIKHPVSDELFSLREHAVKSRRLMARVRERWGDGSEEKPNRELLKFYRTVFESSATPTSISMNGSISGLFQLTKNLIHRLDSAIKPPPLAA